MITSFQRRVSTPSKFKCTTLICDRLILSAQLAERTFGGREGQLMKNPMYEFLSMQISTAKYNTNSSKRMCVKNLFHFRRKSLALFNVDDTKRTHQCRRTPPAELFTISFTEVEGDGDILRLRGCPSRASSADHSILYSLKVGAHTTQGLQLQTNTYILHQETTSLHSSWETQQQPSFKAPSPSRITSTPPALGASNTSVSALSSRDTWHV